MPLTPSELADKLEEIARMIDDGELAWLPREHVADIRSAASLLRPATPNEETIEAIGAALFYSRFGRDQGAFKDATKTQRQVFLSDARAALSAIPSQKEGWRPIESAPKDGTVIMVWPPCKITSWAQAEECVGEEGGWISHYDDGFDAYVAMRNPPTHWMPLPSPPIDGDEKNG